MKRQFIILIILAVASTAFLFSLPKIVVKSESAVESKANRDQVIKKTTTTNEETTTHAMTLSKADEKKVNDLKVDLQKSKDKNSTIKILAEISIIYNQANRLDSAAFYAEKIALLNPTQKTWLQAGDAYTQAANLSLRQPVGEALANKARIAYQKVLTENPHNLQAKTNMAMTWVASQTPMQGIMLLREVLEEAPNYEPALMSLGMLSIQSNQFSKAIDRFKQVLKINPKNTLAQFYLAMSLIETKENTEAKKLLEDLLKKEKDPAIIQEVKKALESL